MKRFTAAIILMLFLLCSGFFLNGKIISAAENMIQLIDSEADSETIIDYYDNNRLLFSLILSKEQTSEIKENVENLKTNEKEARKEIKSDMMNIRDSMKLTVYNIL